MASPTQQFTGGRTPRPGEPIQMKSFAGLADAGNAARFSLAGNIGIQTSGGVVVIPNTASAGYNGVSLGPFDLSCSVDGSTLSVTMNPGSINGVLVSNALSVLTAAYSTSAITYAIVTITSDGISVTGSSWSLSTSLPAYQTATANSMPTSYAIVFGVILGSTPKRTIGQGSLIVSPASYPLQVPKSTIAPNVIPWDNYFMWSYQAGA